MKLIPAFVDSWDGKILRVFIEGYTDGAEIGIKAEVCYPLADRPDYTGYKIQKGDAIWVMFNDGDTNSPIVMGFRNANTGASKDIRRFEHKHFEAHAEQNMKMTSTQHEILASSLFSVEGDQIVLKGNVKIDGPLSVTGGMSGGGTLSMKGNIETQGDINASGNIHANSVTDNDGDGGA